MNRKKLLILLLFVTMVVAGCNSGGKEKVVLTMFHAGSLSVPLKKIEADFEKLHPNIDIQREPSGSTKAARKISDLGKKCDIMASADFRVIDKLLIPKHANWNIRFATNRMVLCYTEKSKYADKINSSNWYEIIAKPGVTWGHSDPNLDPCGYRSIMVMQLAELHYKKKGLFKKLIASRKKENVLPKSVQLIGRLQTATLDYAWEYRSVAVQHKLKFIELPEEINLGSDKSNSFYTKASVEVTGKKPGTMMMLKGKSITYGITIPLNAPHKKEAALFVEYLLSKDGGMKVLEEMGQPPLTPAVVPSKEMQKNIPEGIGKLTTVSK
jgi:molybdate/tungstate transport system substrate-binding protein